MKINIRIGAGLLAVGICLWSTQLFAQTTTVVTTTKGAFSEYVPGSETVVVKNESSTTPLVRYVVTKQTTVVDETGAPVAIERIAPGTPLSVQYRGMGDRFVVSRIVVQRPTVTTTTVPVTTGAAVTDQQTTTTTTRPLTKEEKHHLKEAREHPEREAKKQAEEEHEHD
jgi:hypothetical protein